MATSRWPPLLPLLVLLALAPRVWSREAALPAECLAAGTSPPITDLKTALAANASDLIARFKLADAWSDAGCFNDALQVLEAGQAQNPRSTELDARIRVARSIMSEQVYFDKLDEAQQSAKLSRAVFRCTQLSDPASCDEALNMKPNDPTLLIAKADTLMQLKRSGEAIAAYRRALASAPSHETAAAKIGAAETLRRTQLDTCESKEGDAAAHACEAAWLPGAPDELAVLKRRGFLLQEMHQPSAALDAYLFAARLKPDDTDVAAAVVALSTTTGRSDPGTLEARGEALVALGRAPEAIVPLTHALQLQPGSVKAQRSLRIARRAAQQHASAEPVRHPAGAVNNNAANAANAANNTARYSNDAPATRSN